MDVEYDDGIDWSPCAGSQRAGARKLLRAFNRQVGGLVDPGTEWALRRGAGAVHRLLGSQFGAEIESLAAALGAEPQVLLVANLAYDLSNSVGCSTFVATTRSGPLLARNLDWTGFPGGLLRDHTTVVRVEGSPAGRYSMIGWPGLFGAFSGVASARFSVAVNFVQQEHNSPMAALARAVKGSWPVPWAVRIALDQCATFGAAVRLLCSASLISPVLFTVAGVRRGEGVVIERGPDDYAVRKMEDGRVLVTNHYQTEEYEADGVDLEEMDTEERLARMEELLDEDMPRDASSALRLLSRRDVLGSNTQHQVAMNAAAETLHVRVPGGRTVSISI